MHKGARRTADVFESVTGAIFIDSEGSLTTLQNSFQPFLNDANGNKKRNFRPPNKKIKKKIIIFHSSPQVTGK
jgi:dsRNA-specific ribonuclease